MGGIVGWKLFGCTGGDEFYDGSHGKASNGDTKGETEREKTSVLVINGQAERWGEIGGEREGERGLENSRVGKSWPDMITDPETDTKLSGFGIKFQPI